MTITLRQKDLENDNKSLYLDIYENGKRKFEFLSLYLLPEINDEIKARNQETLKRAQEMTDAVKAELKAIAEHGPDPDDMKKAMEFWRKQQPATQESNTFWYSFLQNYYENGLLWETDRQKVEQFITAEAIQKFARHIIDHDNLKTVIVMPAEEKLAE